METKITRLRNLMGPVINYFRLEKHFSSQLLFENERKQFLDIIHSEFEQANANIPKIRQILSEIPDDAIK